MKVLVIGSGGREHTLVWKIAQSPKVKHIFCAPGNAGISKIATCVDISATNIDELIRFAVENKIDLTVAGPEAPLVAGIVDEFEKKGLRIFGPSKVAAQIEGSKVFSKNLMEKYDIPTAKFKVFEREQDALDYIERMDIPLVVKAEGLAAGKGVIIARDKVDAVDAVKSMLVDKSFGEAGSRIVIEEFLEGPEVTLLSFCDGKTIKTMVSSRDYKRIYDNNEGPNTGGMGAISPAPAYDDKMKEIVEKEIIQKTIDAMAGEGITFKGILYTGIMLTKDGPKVLEYNCRFGDPETQVVIPRLGTDLVDILEAVIDGTLDKVYIKWKKETALCIVGASGGYPLAYETGKLIEGIEEAEKQGALVVHAGTATKDNEILTAGGRVLGVIALGKDVSEARTKAYEAISHIHFEGIQYRSDIGL